jgi:hypothetical protein
MDDQMNAMESMHQQGLVSGVVQAGTLLAERSIEQGFGLARDIHGEVQKSVTATIDWIEASQRSTIGVVRHVHARYGAFVDAIFDALEQSSRATVVTVKSTTDGATRLVSHTAAAISGSPQPN